MRSSTKGMQMKKNLGKTVLLVLILLSSMLKAAPLATYELYANKKSAFVKEPIEVTFIAHQKDHDNFMFFFVKPKKSDDYKITLLEKKTKENAYHNNTATFTFILFPLKAKTINVDFDFYVKTSSDNAVARAYVADHDEGRGIDGDISHIPTKALSLKVSELSKRVALIGDFKLDSEIDKKEINQYENVNLHYRLYGSGYNDVSTILKDIKGTDIFSDIQNTPLKLTMNGYEIDRDYTYAISAKKDFIVPSVTLQAYSPSKKQFYTLHSDSYKIKVNKIDINTILDKEESPVKKELINFKTLKEIFIYIFIFLSGYLAATLTKKEFFTLKKEKKFQDIRNAKSAKELILVLLNRYKNRDIEKFVKELEEMMETKDSSKFHSIQKRILKEFT